MKRIKIIGFTSLCMALVLSASACTGKQSNAPAESATEEITAGETADGAKATEENAESETVIKAEQLLEEMTKAIEMQYPGQTFTDMKKGEAEISPLLFEGAYLYSRRQSSGGFKYIAAVSTSKENPLEGMTCGNGVGVNGFIINQFDNGRLLLMEEDVDEDHGLAYLYGALQQGEAGIRYLAETGARGVSLIPPADHPFLKVSMVKEGLPITEFIPLSEEEREKLLNGTPVSGEETWTDSIALCDSIDELSAVWEGKSKPATVEMAAAAAEKCDFDTPQITDIQNIVKAQLSATFYGEERIEVLENREDLERLVSLLEKAKYTDTQYNREYSGQLQLTRQDGEVVTLQLAVEDGGFILGNAVFCELPGEETAAIWSLFSRIEGFRRYGDKITLQMESPSVTTGDAELKFTLLNYTGGMIHYSLSPVLYKKTENHSEETWKQIEAIGGFCGTNNETTDDETPLKIPWKGIFGLEGPGTYKIEIQVMPEQDLRFEISDEFELK